MSTLRFVFWGSSNFGVYILEELAHADILPSLIITSPSKPKGRGLLLTENEVKVWASAHDIKTLEPTDLKSETFLKDLGSNWDLFVVASYGKIIPGNILEGPKHGTLNVHPSLLPKLRGASPIQSAILEDAPVNTPWETGATIMLVDNEVDHGPIVAQERMTIPSWPPKETDLEKMLGELGGKLLAKTIPLWVAGNIIPTPQDHNHATYTKKMTKESGHIDLKDDPVRMYRKIRAFNTSPRAYFTTLHAGHEIRIIVTEAHLENGVLVLDRVIPEGKREMSYAEFLRGKK